MASLRQEGARWCTVVFTYGWRVAVPLGVVLVALQIPNPTCVLGQVRADAPRLRRADPLAATTSEIARRNAIASIPFEQLDRAGREKVNAVIQDTTAFRRLPTQVVDCDPHLFLFLVRHPDVAVNIWQVLKLSSLDLRQTDPDRFELVEPSGTRLHAEFLHQSPEIHVIYCEGIYVGPILGRPVHGRAVLVLRSGYVHETNGRQYVTTRLDTFLQVQEGGPDLLTKLLHPVAGRTADHNFLQVVAFAGSLSRTAEMNYRGVQRLAGQLLDVRPELRVRLSELAADIGHNSPRQAAATAETTPVLASHEAAQ